MRTPRKTLTAGTQEPSPRPARGRRAHAGAPADEPADDLAVQAAGGMRAGGWRIRPRTVRAKVVCLLMVPVVSLIALWAYATVTTAQDVSRLRQSQRVDAALRTPLADAVAALQAERTAAVRYAAGPTAGQATDLRTLGTRTDGAVAALRLGKDSTVADSAELPAGVAGRLRTFVTGAERLRTLRAAVLDRGAGRDETYERYTRTIATAFTVDGALTGVQADDMGADARVLHEFSRAGEALAQEDALLAGARRAGGLDGTRLSLFTGAVGTRRVLTDAAVADLPGAQRTAWRRLAGGDDYTALSAAEDGVLAGRPGADALAAAPETAWASAHARVRDGMRARPARHTRSPAGPTRSPAACSPRPAPPSCSAFSRWPPPWSSPSASDADSWSNWSACATARWRSPGASCPRRCADCGRARRSTCVRRHPRGRPRRTRPDRSRKPSPRCTGPPCAPPWNVPNSPAASRASSSTSPVAARSWSTVS